MGPFDISPEDVQILDDNQLRRILGSLLEAEAHQHGIPLSAIGLGGHQNALDGGVDARVQWDEQPASTPWLPRTCTVFQSKAEDMGPARVSREMALGGKVRPVFQDLAQNRGSYIIFSTVNCTDQMYLDRLQAMNTAIAGITGRLGIHLDFYDASRIARWVNCFPGVANELRKIIGRPLSGWHSYENWSAPQLSAEDEYIVDENPKVTLDFQDDILLVTDAIDQVRTLLQEKSHAVRLIGLSGVGKTRFAQALFDRRVGTNPLNKGCAVYGDLSESPEIPSSQVAEQLLHSQRESVLIVDNCPESVHRALAKIICRDSSRVSLLTIDFDIGEDRPENTRVFELHENAARLIDTLLARRVPDLSFFDRPRVIDFAGGNARVALAIARNSEPGEALADLSDRQLLSRLFLNERRRVDEEMLRCAEVASLVYAFHVDQEENQTPEHPVLAELAEVTDLTMYRYIAQFCEELGIAQKRGTQRAILPRALAVKLAIQCLDRLPPEQVLNHFDRPDIRRLFTSFCRRLGDLHQSEHACRIVRRLIGRGRKFFDLSSMSPEDREIFASLAPVLPEEALAALEQAVTGPGREAFLSTANPSKRLFISLLRNLAYDEELFERAAQVLLCFLKEDGEGFGSQFGHENFLEMFWIVLSHTQASPEFRFGFLDQMLANEEPVEKGLAVLALGCALKTNHFTSSFVNTFGSRPRGNEWRPKNLQEQESWFSGAFSRLVTLACQDSDLANPAKKEIEKNIRGLIGRVSSDAISSGLRAIRKLEFWAEGWKALCTAIHFDNKGWSEEIRKEMVHLEASLRPVSVEDRFCAYVISEPWGLYSVEDDGHDKNDDEKLVISRAKEVGGDVAQDMQKFPELARLAMACHGHNACRAFGAGLAEKVPSLQGAWDGMLAIAHEMESPDPDLLYGFLKGAYKQEPETVEKWLDDLLENEKLIPHIVELSTAVPLTERSLNRLLKAVKTGNTPLHTFSLLKCGGVMNKLPQKSIVGFLRDLSNSGPEGTFAAVDVLHMYFFSHKEKGEFIPEMYAVGKELIFSAHVFQNHPRREMYKLEEIAKRCLVGEEHKLVAQELCKKILSSPRQHIFKWDRFLRELGELHPKAVLDLVLQDDETASVAAPLVFGRTDDDLDDDQEKKYLSALNDDLPVLRRWMQENSPENILRLARNILYCISDDAHELHWSPIAKLLIEHAELSTKVLDIFFYRFDIGAGSGPWSHRLVRRRPLIEQLKTNPNEAIQAWASQALATLDTRIKELQERERRENERFE